MRAEEKQVDGPDLQRAEQKESLRERDEKELQQGLHNERPIDKERDTLLVSTMKAIVDKRPVLVRELGLPPRETQALEMLQNAVIGRHVRMDTFVYAEDRRALLEQALAVLQPNLTSSHTSVVESVRTEVEQLVGSVHELRLNLMNLEDSQEDPLEGVRRREVEATSKAGDTEAKPAPSDDDKKSTLSDGLEATKVAARSSLADGPEVKRDDKPTDIWVDPDPDEPGLPKKPWWRRALGQ